MKKYRAMTLQEHDIEHQESTLKDKIIDILFPKCLVYDRRIREYTCRKRIFIIKYLWNNR